MRSMMVSTKATLLSMRCGCLMSDTLHPFASISTIFVVACYDPRNEKWGCTPRSRRIRQPWACPSSPCHRGQEKGCFLPLVHSSPACCPTTLSPFLPSDPMGPCLEAYVSLRKEPQQGSREDRCGARLLTPPLFAFLFFHHLL